MIKKEKRVILIVGATGYIGSEVLNVLKNKNFNIVCTYRDKTNRDKIKNELIKENECITWFNVDWKKEDLVLNFLKNILKVDIIISCIASRNGGRLDSNLIDYRANRYLLKFAEEKKVNQFIMISAICVQKPRLYFQHAKLEFEKELVNSNIPFTIIRPTAFFKSLSGQIKRVQNGKKFVIFKNGNLTKCKPISSKDLSNYVYNCIDNKEKLNKVLPLGGPGPAVNSKQIGEMIFKQLGKKPKFKKISPNIFKIFILFLYPISFFSTKIQDKIEFMKIAYYYATESMLVYDFEKNRYSDKKTPEYGEDYLSDFFKNYLNNYKENNSEILKDNRLF